MLKQRLIFGALGVILAILIITFCPVYIIGICVGIIAAIGLGEFYNVTGLIKKKSAVVVPGFIASIVFCAISVVNTDAFYDYMVLITVAYVFVLMLMMVFFRSNCSFSDVALSFAGTIYVTVFFLHIFFVRKMNLGNLLIWVLFISAWSTDTFAYFAGRCLGKHKLCPSISPKKTVEGAFGGVVGCLICVCAYVAIVAKYNSLSVNYFNTVILALVASVFSQVGDLAASCIKRENNVKDYGNLIPGHGGILDRFDSVLLISPVVYYIMTYLPVFK